MNMLDLGTPQLPGDKKGIEFREILSVIWRRKWLIFIPVVASLIVGVLLCRFLPKMYTSIAYIHFGRPEYTVEKPTREMLISHQTAFRERARMLEIDVTRQTVLMPVFEEEGLIDLHKSQSILGRIKTFLFLIDPGPDPARSEQYEAARNDLLVEFREDQPIIIVEYTATNRVVARDVCDKIAGMIFKKDRESGKILEEQESRYRTRRDTAEEALKDQKIRIKGLVAEAQREDKMPERLDYMNRRLEAARADMRHLEDKVSRDSGSYAIWAIKVQSLERTVPIARVAGGVELDAEDKLARDKLEEYEDYVNRLIEAYGRSNYRVVEARKMLRSLRRDAAIDEQKLQLLPIKLPALRSDSNRLDKEMNDKRALLQKKMERREELRGKIEKDAALSNEDPDKMLPSELDAAEKELNAIANTEEPELRKEMAGLQKEWMSVKKELEEYERLARITGYSQETFPAVAGEGEDKEGETEGEATPSGLIERELQDEKIQRILKELFGGRIPSNLNPDWLDAVVHLMSLEVSIKRDKSRLVKLEEERDDLEDRIGRTFTVQAQLKGMREDEGELAAKYERALERFEKAEALKMLFERSRGMGRGGEGADVKRFAASLPLVHSSPRFALIMILVGVGGVVLGGALTLLAEMTDHTVKRPIDLQRVIDRPVLAAIPSLDIGRFHTPENLFFRTKRVVEADLESGMLYDRSYVREIRHRSIATEQIRKLRLRMNTTTGERVRTILVTSALAGEGKSTVAANLAVAISQMIGEHVLLVDGDLRRPDLHNFFGLPPKPGLAEYLEYDLDLSQLLVKTDFDKLTMLQAGKVPANSTELLNSEKMRHLIMEVKSRYPDRYIVVDSPPVLSTPEPDVLGGQVDGIVLVVRAGMTPREMVEDVLLSLNPDKVLGIVMNDVRSGVGRYYSPSYA